ncbi:hypothetical protein AB0G79_12825 [Streptomyces sp. NPDC020807]|uniref:hypothetical protein n=1 Tax=Streptomyces sp. NPDC020807 TaxID=3155119 RepID=UPI0033D7C32F
MSASENSGRNHFHWTGPYAVPDHPDLTWVDGPGVDEAAAYAARDGGSGLWAAARAHRTVAAGAAVGAAAALALAYGWGRRTGRLAARRDLGRAALFFERRG